MRRGGVRTAIIFIFLLGTALRCMCGGVFAPARAAEETSAAGASAEPGKSEAEVSAEPGKSEAEVSAGPEESETAEAERGHRFSWWKTVLISSVFSLLIAVLLAVRSGNKRYGKS